jgi:nuclease HARBI1
MFGPISGRRHDAVILRQSGLVEIMRDRLPQFAIYGDPAYPLSSVLLRPFRGAAVASEAEAEFNTAMSSVRESVEWSFGAVTNLFQALSFSRKEKMMERPLAQSYQVATLLFNCRTCLREGNQISSYFAVDPPQLQDYLAQRH